VHRERRLAFVSAVNYDAGAPFNHKREGNDRWFPDPRISKDFQTDNSHYASNPLDRGHLVRRADAAWGETEEEARLANDDTFHFANCSPQHEVYNQSTKADDRGLLLWGNLEEHVAKEAKRDKKKLCVFNGPVLRSNDRPYRGIRVPKEFYKIVVFEKDNGDRSALAFLLSQDALIQDLPPEDFQIGPYRPFQVKVGDIETMTKLDFGDLRDLDPLESPENESFFESGTEAVPLASASDIVF
jgi:endonuclease G